jgi:hypothetical protein
MNTTTIMIIKTSSSRNRKNHISPAGRYASIGVCGFCIRGAAFIVLSLMEISSPNLSSYYNYDTVIHSPMRSININSSSPQLHGSDQYYQFEQQQEQPSSPHHFSLQVMPTYLQEARKHRFN